MTRVTDQTSIILMVTVSYYNCDYNNRDINHSDQLFRAFDIYNIFDTRSRLYPHDKRPISPMRQLNRAQTLQTRTETTKYLYFRPRSTRFEYGCHVTRLTSASAPIFMKRDILHFSNVPIGYRIKNF